MDTATQKRKPPGLNEAQKKRRRQTSIETAFFSGQSPCRQCRERSKRLVQRAEPGEGKLQEYESGAEGRRVSKARHKGSGTCWKTSKSAQVESSNGALKQRRIGWRRQGSQGSGTKWGVEGSRGPCGGTPLGGGKIGGVSRVRGKANEIESLVRGSPRPTLVIALVENTQVVGSWIEIPSRKPFLFYNGPSPLRPLRLLLRLLCAPHSLS